MYKWVRARSILTPFSVHVQDAYALSAARCHFMAGPSDFLGGLRELPDLGELPDLKEVDVGDGHKFAIASASCPDAHIFSNLRTQCHGLNCVAFSAYPDVFK